MILSGLRNHKTNIKITRIHLYGINTINNVYNMNYENEDVKK